jgi:hypothetical protein
MKDREEAGERHRDGQRWGERERQSGAEHHNRKTDAELEIGHPNTGNAERASERHHCHKRERHEP